MALITSDCVPFRSVFLNAYIIGAFSSIMVTDHHRHPPPAPPRARRIPSAGPATCTSN